MSHHSLLVACLVCICLSPTAANAAKKDRNGEAKQLRAEIRELRQLLTEASERLEAMEQRLDRIAKKDVTIVELDTRQHLKLRPLGGYQVDQHGIIWHDGTPVGVWGVWRTPTGMNAPRVEPVPRR